VVHLRVTNNREVISSSSSNLPLTVTAAAITSSSKAKLVATVNRLLKVVVIHMLRKSKVVLTLV
jgi:hypothetical protein